MGRKVWSSLLIGIALGIFIAGTLYTYVFQPEPGQSENRNAQESPEESTAKEEGSSHESRGSEPAAETVVEFEIEENHSMEELVYDLMVEGIISSKHQQQQIYEVLTYGDMDPGIRKIPIHASTEEILEAITNP